MNNINIMSRKAGSAPTGKKILYFFVNMAVIVALGLGTFLPTTQASVIVSDQPVSLVTSALTLPANSPQTAVFSFGLMSTAGETFSNVTVQVNSANTTTQVLGTHIASVSLYRDDGSGQFNASAGNLIGSQSVVNIGAPTQIFPNAGFVTAGKYYVTIATSSLWGGSGAQADSITVTLPANGITTSANSPITSQVVTAAISAGVTSPQLVSAVAQNTGGTAAKESGDSIALDFSQPTNKFMVNNVNIGNQFTLSNGHSFLDSSGNLGGANWDASGTVLTLVLSGQPSASGTLPTVIPGDVISLAGTTSITDMNNSQQAGGFATISGNFGGTSTTSPSSTSRAIAITLSAAQAQFNAPVYATAFLTNLMGNAGGTVTYNAYPGSSCVGTPVFTDTESVSNGITPLSKDFSTTATGAYSWQAVYSGDANNTGVSSSCQPELVLAPGQSSGQQIAGASTSLPTTGMPPGILFLLMAGLAAWLNFKFKLI